MKNIQTTLACILLAVLSAVSYNVSAQYNIQIDANPSLNKLCMDMVYAPHYIRLYNGTTNVTTTTPNLHFYINNWEAMGPQGGYYTFGAGCGPSGSGYELYMPGNSYTTAYFAGSARIYAVNTSSNCILAYKDITIYPDNTWIDSNALSGPSVIGNPTFYSLNAADQFASGASLSGTAYINPYIASFYNVTTSGGYITIAPHDDAPISPSLIVSCPFTPPGSPCGSAPMAQKRFSRTPVLSGGTPNGILCSGSATLSVNVSDYPGYPSVPPSSPVSNQYIKHFTFQWYKNSVAISGANSRTYTVTTPGSYYVSVTETGQHVSGGTWSWNAAPTITKNSGTINFTAPSGTAPLSSFKINSSIPSNTAPGRTLFYCNPIIFDNTSTGTINYYKLEVFDAANGTSIYSSGDQYTTPPSGIDLRPLMNSGNPVSGVFRIRLTTSTGCPSVARSIADRFVKISPGPNANMTSYTSAIRLVPYTLRVYDPVSVSQTAPDTVGRYGTTFYWTGTYGSGVTVCSYHLYLDKWTGSTWSQVWDNLVPVSGCDTAGGIPVVPLASIGDPDPVTHLPFFVDAANAANGSVWRLRTYLANDCGTAASPLISVFTPDPAYLRPAGSNENGTTPLTAEITGKDLVKFTPVPFHNELNVLLNLNTNALVSLQLYTIDGRLMKEVYSTSTMPRGAHTEKIIVADWPAGMYFYKLQINDAHYSGKLLKN